MIAFLGKCSGTVSNDYYSVSLAVTVTPLLIVAKIVTCVFEPHWCFSRRSGLTAIGFDKRCTNHTVHANDVAFCQGEEVKSLGTAVEYISPNIPLLVDLSPQHQ